MTEQEKNEMISYRIHRAKETLNEVEILINNQLWTTSINRLYYACFYAVSALLLKNDINAQSHRGTRQMFGLHFVKTEIIPGNLGKFYTDIFDMRHTGDYDDFVDFTKEDVLDALVPARELIEQINNLL